MLITINQTDKYLESSKATDLIKFLIDNEDLLTDECLATYVSEDLNYIMLEQGDKFKEFEEFINDFDGAVAGIGLDDTGMLDLNDTDKYMDYLTQPEYNELDKELLKMLARNNLHFIFYTDEELSKDNWDKVNVKNHWGGWYSFSPSGHAYYNGNDELLIRGKKALVAALNDYHVLGVGRDVYKDTEIIYNN